MIHRARRFVPLAQHVFGGGPLLFLLVALSSAGLARGLLPAPAEIPTSTATPGASPARSIEIRAAEPWPPIVSPPITSASVDPVPSTRARAPRTRRPPHQKR